MALDRPRRLFVAGATGATGRVLVRLAREAGSPVVPQVRPKSAARAPEQARIVDLADHAALVGALSDCTTVLQLIGTTRRRFSTGDTYEASDVGTTRQLVDAAHEAGVDHLVLLSSVGAGRPRGAYLKAKSQAEALVRASGLDWTIFRPSMFVGEEHEPPRLVVALADRLAPAKYRPIRVAQLARALLHAGLARAPLQAVLEGRALWDEVARAG